MLGNFLSCNKGLKDPFEVQECMCDLAREASAEKGQILPMGEPPGFSIVGSDSSQVMTGTSGTRSCGLRKGQSSCELRGASRDSSSVGAGS